MGNKRTVRLTVATALVLVVATALAWRLYDNRPTGHAAGAKTKTSTTLGPVDGVPSTSKLPGPSGSSGIALGVYVKPDPAIGNEEATLGRFETTIDRRMAIVQTFTGWQTASGATIPFPTAFASYAATIGAAPMVTWQPEQIIAGKTRGSLLSNQPEFSLLQLTSGRYDTYIRSWADEAKAFGRVVYVRPMQEMNDRTYPWSLGVNGNTSPQQYIAAWRHIVGIFQAEGATNVQFVWCVGAKPVIPNPAEFFPGDSYISWISLDGYNRGTPWESFSSIFSLAYREIVAVSTRPVMIAETGTVEDPTDPAAKAAWITSSFDQEIPQQFPKVRAVLYFDAPGRGFSYALTSSGATLNAFRQVAQSSEFQAHAPL